jgi:hypothetical protein
MMMPFIYVGAGALGLFVVLYLAKGLRSKGGDLCELSARLRPIDVQAFRNLIDQREEEYLREHLSSGDFRSIHRERMLAAVEYVWCATRNTSILISLGEAAMQSPDPAVVTAAEKLIENSQRLRLYAMDALPRMYVSMVFPIASRAPQSIAETYDAMARQAVVLGCMQRPARGMSPAV